MAQKKYDVVIVGAGPVGLSLAAVLANSGLSIGVFESVDEISMVSRASTFHPPTLEMLSTVGITDKLIDKGVIVTDWQYRVHPNGPNVAFNTSVLESETPFPYRVQVEQAVLCKILAQELSPLPNIDIEFGAEIVGLEQNDERVAVRVKKAEESFDVEAKFVVGCDGAHSFVRRSVGIDFVGSTYEESSILISVDYPFQNDLDDLPDVSYCWHDDGDMFSLMRVQDYWRVALIPGDSQSVEEATRPEAVQLALQKIVRRKGDYPVANQRVYKSHQRVAAHYRAGRLLLAGDAAHVSPSSGGTGMNAGIHDAFFLAKYLTPVARGERAIETLDGYEQCRRAIMLGQVMPHAKKMRDIRYEKDSKKILENLAELKAISADEARRREYLIHFSMLHSVRESYRLAQQA